MTTQEIIDYLEEWDNGIITVRELIEILRGERPYVP